MDSSASFRTHVNRLPHWARPRKDTTSEVDAAYAAGAALQYLDALIRSEPNWSGVWRQRLATRSAAAAARLIGRREDEGALRDAYFFRTSGAPLGPSGDLLLAWRTLVDAPPTLDERTLRHIAELFDVGWDEAIEEVIDNAEQLAASTRPAPLVAAELAAELYRARPDAELLAIWIADALLAKRLSWPFPVPLLATQLNSAALRAGEERRRVRPGATGWFVVALNAYAQAAAAAADLAVDLSARAERLTTVAPKLRAKGAQAVLERLLGDDAVPSSRSNTRLSDRSSRRLFERLDQLGVVRELSGRTSFRLYGL